MQNLNWIKGFYRWRGGNRFFTLGHICNFLQRGRYFGRVVSALKVIKLDNFDWLCLTLSNVWMEANESSSIAPSSTYLKLFPSEKLKIVTKCKLPPSSPNQPSAKHQFEAKLYLWTSVIRNSHIMINGWMLYYCDLVTCSWRWYIDC